MVDPTQVNPQVKDAIATLQKAVLDGSVVTAAGAGMAYQSVAQSAAIAVQDAADTLRNMSTIATTAAGVALAQLLATKDPAYAEVITQANLTVTNAAANFLLIGQNATQVLSQFPSG